jgi:hypothetical protein
MHAFYNTTQGGKTHPQTRQKRDRGNPDRQWFDDLEEHPDNPKNRLDAAGLRPSLLTNCFGCVFGRKAIEQIATASMDSAFQKSV